MLRSSFFIASFLGMMLVFQIACPTCSAEILHDYTRAINRGTVLGNENPFGQILVLDQVAEVSSVEFFVSSGPAFTVTTDIGVQLRSINPSTSQPIETLWSTVVPAVDVSRTPSLISVDVPDVEVPNWVALTITSSSASIGLKVADPDPMHFGANAGFISFFENEWIVRRPGAPLSIRLSGEPLRVPEPNSVALLLTIAGACLLRRSGPLLAFVEAPASS